MPRFSVIIPCFNRADLIAKALQSVRDQTFSDYQIIVIDDGSTDGSPDIVRRFPEVKLLLQANAGPSAARNRGIAEAQGDYIVFLDSDDLWFPWALQTLQSNLLRHNQPAVISGRHINFHDESEVSQIAPAPDSSELFPDLLAFMAHHPSEIPHTSTVAVRTSDLRQVGGFMPQRVWAEDSDLWLKLGIAPGFAKIYSPPICAVRLHGSNISNQLDPWIRGLEILIDREHQGGYPGGSSRRRIRRALIASATRSCAVRCLDARLIGRGMGLYRKSLRWHIALGRLKFLAAYPLLAAAASLRPRPSSTPGST